MTVRENSKGMSGHQRGYIGKNQTWLTPPKLIKALGTFELDPCCPNKMPWATAETMFRPKDDGLWREWFGRVWLNPPYGPNTGEWLKKLAEHNNGTALIFARTETEMFFEHVWSKATTILFLKGRLHFHYEDGSRAKANAGAPSCLVAYDNDDPSNPYPRLNSSWLHSSGLGRVITLK